MRMNLLYIGIITALIMLILPASASVDTLGVYGNANLDNTINMQDVTYTELIILEYKDTNDLADAKFDENIDILDVTQIELIILQKEKQLTFVDSDGEAKTISKPIDSILVLNPDCAEAIRAIEAKDRIIAIESATARYSIFFPDISTLPSIGMGSAPDLEKILEMNPDILIAYAPGVYNPDRDVLEDNLEPEVPIVRLNLYKTETVEEDLIKLGYLLGEIDNARDYIEWRDGYTEEIKNIVSGIPEDDKPKCFIDYGGQRESTNRMSGAKGTGLHQMVAATGGMNIAADLPGGLAPGYPYVELEWILSQEPDVIIGQASGYNTREGGYETDDDTTLIAYYDEITGLTGFDELSAVENQRTHIVHADIAGGLADVVGLAYHAKWIHPDLFEDLNPQEIHQEYIDEFCDIDFDTGAQGVFMYCPQ